MTYTNNAPQIMKAILELKLHTSIGKKEFTIVQIDYLKTLIKTYPQKTQESILVALNTGWYPFVLDSAKFNKKSLDTLIKEDKENPLLWKILKSTMPVKAHFTATEKIQSYIDLASAYFKGSFGQTQKYLGALEMARCAYAVATMYPTAENIIQAKIAFSPTPQCPSIDTDLKEKLLSSKRFGDLILYKVNKSQDPLLAEKVSSKLTAFDLIPNAANRSKKLAPLVTQNQKRFESTKQGMQKILNRSLTPNEKQLAMGLNELMTAHESFIQTMFILYEFLPSLQQVNWLNKSEKTQLSNYTTEIYQLLQCYNELDLFKVLQTDAPIELADAITKIIGKFKISTSPTDEEKKYIAFIERMQELIKFDPIIEKIESQHITCMQIFVTTSVQALKKSGYACLDHMKLIAFAKHPFQLICKYHLLFDMMHEHLKKIRVDEDKIEDKIGEALKTVNLAHVASKKIAETANTLRREQENLQKSEGTASEEIAGAEFDANSREDSISSDSQSNKTKERALADGSHAASHETLENAGTSLSIATQEQNSDNRNPESQVHPTTNLPPKRNAWSIILPVAGGLLGIGIGVALTMTGIFAPFGAGFIGVGAISIIGGGMGVAVGDLLRYLYKKTRTTKPKTSDLTTAAVAVEVEATPVKNSAANDASSSTATIIERSLSKHSSTSSICSKTPYPHESSANSVDEDRNTSSQSAQNVIEDFSAIKDDPGVVQSEAQEISTNSEPQQSEANAPTEDSSEDDHSFVSEDSEEYFDTSENWPNFFNADNTEHADSPKTQEDDHSFVSEDSEEYFDTSENWLNFFNADNTEHADSPKTQEEGKQKDLTTTTNSTPSPSNGSADSE